MELIDSFLEWSWVVTSPDGSHRLQTDSRPAIANMEASGCLSPESTVTSLLSSSGHLRSSLLVPEHNTTFRYRHKNYNSASAALDAYITDFERSRQDSAPQTGRLLLPQRPPCTPRKLTLSELRNRDVLKERLTDGELDFLNLPVSSLHHRVNRDRLSMTTDELLSIPYDGSMPVTHTSAFIQGSSRPPNVTWDRLGSSHGAPQQNHFHPPRSSRCRERPGAATLNPHVDVSSVSCHCPSAHRAEGPEWAEPPSFLYLPRWLTSNKTEMDCSGISSVPDLKYPAWVQRCDLSETTPPPTDSEGWDDHGVCPSAVPRHGPPSWVAQLHGDDPNQTPAQVDSRQALRDLRLQFAEQISLLSAERGGADVMDSLFRGNRMESLIQKADQVLNSLAHSSEEADGPAGPVRPAGCVEDAVSPVSTTELLLSSPRCRTTPWSSASSSGSAAEAPPLQGAQAWDSSLHGNSVFKQPGPVEALKQMLFRLQAVEAELQRRHPAPAAPALAVGLQAEEQRPEGEAERQRCPGGPSLQRAMHHLSRLKMLVEEPRERPAEEEEERDEDEGRYSSSSADGLVCSPRKPS